MSKQDLINLAKQKFNAKQFQESLDLYYQAYTEFPDDWNSWDAYFLIKCLRENAQLPDGTNIEHIVSVHLSETQVKNLYTWYLYDIYVKNFDKDNIHKHEKGIQKITELIEQKDKVNNNDDYPCPYTMAVFILLKAYKEPNFNLNKIQQWIVKLDPEKLSRRGTQSTNTDGTVRKIASDYETYYSILTSLLEKQQKYRECIEACDLALSSITTFHYDNDIWFKRRKALSLIELGDLETGKSILLEIINKHQGQKWYIYRELAQAQFDLGEYEDALTNCCKSALFREDEHKKIQLFLLMARCYYKLGEKEKAKLLAKLINLLIQKYELKKTDDIQNILHYFKISDHTSDLENDLRQLRRQLRQIWKQDQLRQQEIFRGIISAIHKNKKSGHLTCDKDSFFFGMRDAQCNKDHLKKGTEVEFYLKDAQNQKGEKENHAVITRVIQ
jgi:tetratricopeptide (TPR) repeat protein